MQWDVIANISSLFEFYIDKAVFRCVHTSDTLRTLIELFLEEEDFTANMF